MLIDVIYFVFNQRFILMLYVLIEGVCYIILLQQFVCIVNMYIKNYKNLLYMCAC